MKIKKPSMKGMKCTEYLGHFKQDKFLKQGHNDSGKLMPSYVYQKGEKELDPVKKRQKMFEEFNEEVNMSYDDLTKKMQKENLGTSFKEGFESGKKLKKKKDEEDEY